MVPNDYDLFSEMTNFYGGMWFENYENLKKTVITYLNELTVEEYDMGKQKLVEWYDKCLNVDGDYEEK